MGGASRTLRPRCPGTQTASRSGLDQPTRTINDRRNCSVNHETECLIGVDGFPWDLFILFGPEATWAEAEKHVLGWGEPVIDRAEKLEALLSEVSAHDPDRVPLRSEDRHER